MLALGNARPDGLGGELALAVAEFWLERPFCRGEPAGDVLPCCGADAPVLEGVPAVLVVDQAGGCAELPGERVHREAELCRVVAERCRARGCFEVAVVDAEEGGSLGERAAGGHLDQAEGGGAAEQPGVPADVAEVLAVPVVLQVLGDVLGREGDLGGGCPASAGAPVCALEAVHQGFERVPESAGAVVPGALVAAEPPASRAFPAGAVPGRGQELAEGPQVAAVEDAGGGGDEAGAWVRVQRRGVADGVAPGPGAAHAGDVPVEGSGHARAGDQVPAVRPGPVYQAADEPEVGEVLSGRGRLADAHDGGRLPRAQQMEQPVLQGEQVIRGQGWGGSVEPGPAGAGVPAGGLRGQGRPALGGGQAGGGGGRG